MRRNEPETYEERVHLAKKAARREVGRTALAYRLGRSPAKQKRRHLGEREEENRNGGKEGVGCTWGDR